MNPKFSTFKISFAMLLLITAIGAGHPVSAASAGLNHGPYVQWQRLTVAVEDDVAFPTARAVAADPETAGQLYILRSDGVFRLHDQQLTWQRIAIPSAVMANVAVLLGAYDVIEVGLGPRIYLGSYSEPLLVGDPRQGEWEYGELLSGPGDGDLVRRRSSSRSLRISASQTVPGRAYATQHQYSLRGGEGLSLTIDGGRTWSLVDVQNGRNSSWMAADPIDPLRLLRIWDDGLSESRDGGLTWAQYAALAPGALARDGRVQLNAQMKIDAMRGETWIVSPSGSIFRRLATGEWQEIGRPPTGGALQIAGPVANDVSWWVLGEDGAIWRLTLQEPAPSNGTSAPAQIPAIIHPATQRTYPDTILQD